MRYRNEIDNDITMYSLDTLETMKRVKEHPHTKYNFTGFSLEELTQEIERRTKEYETQEVRNKAGEVNRGCQSRDDSPILKTT